MRDAELLRDGEKLLGRYTVEIARWTGGRLSSTVPPIYVLVSHERLIMTPQTRKRYEPAIIPAHYISNAKNLKADRSGACITLKNGFQINLFITASYNQEFINHVRTIAALPPAREYSAPLDAIGLKKLVEYFSHIS